MSDIRHTSGEDGEQARGQPQPERTGPRDPGGPPQPGQLPPDWPGRRAYLLAGHAVVTIRNPASGNRYTYRIDRNRDTDPAAPRWFVSLLAGPDTWRYLGVLDGDTGEVRLTNKSTFGGAAQPVQAARWVFERVWALEDLRGVELYHDGRCARCGRPLTTPASVARGLGPECAKYGSFR